MELTTDYLQRQFAAFNGRYFSGTLPVPRFAISKSRTMLGQFVVRRKAGLFSSPSALFSTSSALFSAPSAPEYTIKVSVFYDMPEREVQTVLLHEMIHYYIHYHKLRDTSPHGRLFKQIMCAINAAGGWGISVTKNTRLLRPALGRDKQRYVLAAITADGRHFMSVVNERYVARVESLIAGSSPLKWHKWYKTNMPMFSTYSEVRSLRGRKMTAEEFKRTLKAIDDTVAETRKRA